MEKQVDNMCIAYKRHKLRLLLLFMITPIAVGIISTLLSKDRMFSWGDMVKPPLAPPGWLFPVAWTILYLLMGYAGYLIYQSDSDDKGSTLCVWIAQLFLNFTWSPLFFRFDLKVLAAIVLVALLVLIGLLISMSRKAGKLPMFLLIPYFLWCSFALYLNISIIVLN